MAIVGILNGDVLMVGLEEKNIEKLKDDQPFFQDLRETVGLPYTLVIFYGKTMDDLKAAVAEGITPDTVIVDNSRRKKS